MEKAEQITEKAEQDGYDIGVVETKEALKAEVSRCVELTASMCEMRPSTKLGLRPFLP